MHVKRSDNRGGGHVVYVYPVDLRNPPPTQVSERTLSL